MSRWTAVLPLLVAAGCLDAVGPDVGPPVREECRNEDHDPGTPVEFERDIMNGIFRDADIVAKVSRGLGAAMPGEEIDQLDVKLADRGW